MAQSILNSEYETAKLIISSPAGLNENETPDIGEASAGWNFELGARQTEFTPRVPFDLLATTPNAGSVTGICQLNTRAGVQTTLVASGSNVYLWDGTSSGFTLEGTIQTGAKLRDAYWSLGDYIIMADANTSTNNNVSMWDGTTYQDLPTGLGVDFSAQYVIVFLSRVWFFNIWTNGVNYPHMIVASQFENPQILNTSIRAGPADVGGTGYTTGLEAFYLLSPDLKAINGVSLFQNVLAISTVDGQLFVLSGTSTQDFQFTPFYVGSSAVGTEAIQNIGNDVVYVRNGGNINLLMSVQFFGDVRSNDVARWIPDTTKNLSDALIVYEQNTQKVYFFVQNKVLVLFKDILYGAETDTAINAGLSPWSVYVTDHPCKFNTSAAKYMYFPGTTNYSVYFGDSSGNIYDMNGTGNYDGGIYTINYSRTTKLIDEDVISPFPWFQQILLGKLQYHRDAAPVSMNVSFAWSNEYNTSISSMTLKGPPVNNNGPVYNGSAYYNKSSYYSQGFLFTDVISHQDFSPTGKGPGFYLTLGTQGANKWRIDHIELY